MSEQHIKKKNFTDAFTGIRGLLCMFVIHTHNLRTGANGSLKGSYFPVPGFFVLSAYLLTRNLLKEIAPKRGQEPKSVFGMIFVSYLIRRVFRIYPAFIVGAVIHYSMFLYYGFTLPYGYGSLQTIPYILKLGLTPTPFWTMRQEMFFFFVTLPTFIALACILMKIDYKLFKNSKFKTFYLFIAVIAFATCYIVNDVMNNKEYIELLKDQVYVNLWDLRDIQYPHAPLFLYGILAGTASFYLQDYHIDFNSKIKRGILQLITFLIVLYFYYANYVIAAKYLGHTKIEWWQRLQCTGLVFAITLLVLEKGGTNCTLGRVLSKPELVYLGKWSYSIYLTHYNALQWLILHTPAPLNQNMGEFDEMIRMYLIAIFVGFIVYTFVEEPFFKLSKPVIKYIGKIADKILEYKNLALGSFNQKHVQLESTSDPGVIELEVKDSHRPVRN